MSTRAMRQIRFRYYIQLLDSGAAHVTRAGETVSMCAESCVKMCGPQEMENIKKLV